MRISGVLLAAGKSRRMGKNKLLLPFGWHTVIEESLYQLTRSGLDEILVITGFQYEIIESIVKKAFGNDIKLVVNESYEFGRAESIKCAIRNIDSLSYAALFMVADKPTVQSDLIKGAVASYKDKKPSVLFVETPEGRGHPVIFSRAVFNDLAKLDGEPAGNEIFEKYRDDTAVIYDPNPQIDIDTADDYNSLIQESAG